MSCYGAILTMGSSGVHCPFESAKKLLSCNGGPVDLEIFATATSPAHLIPLIQHRRIRSRIVGLVSPHFPRPKRRKR